MHTALVVALFVDFFFFLGLWLALSRSPLIPDLVEWLSTKEPMTHKDVDNWLINTGRMKTLRLWTCPHCQSFWTSLLYGCTTAGILGSEFSNPFYFLLGPVLTLAFYPLYFFSITLLWKR